MNRTHQRIFTSVLVLLLVGTLLTVAGAAMSGSTVDEAAADRSLETTEPVAGTIAVDEHWAMTASVDWASAEASEPAADAGGSESTGIGAEPAPLHPPNGPAAAHHILSEWYYVAVMLIGLAVVALLGYAAIPIIRGGSSTSENAPTPGVPETDGGKLITEDFEVVDDGGDDDVSDDRRNVLKAAAGATTLGITGLSVAEEEAADFIKTHWVEMSQAERENLVENIEHDLREEFDNPDIDVSAKGPMDDVVFGYALNVQKCIGCRRCVYACVEENNQSRVDPENPASNQIQWIRVIQFNDEKIEPGLEREGGQPYGQEMTTNFGEIKSGVDWHQAEHFYEPEETGDSENWYLPTQCQQCESPSCTRVCPVQATWKEQDGIVVVDYDRCIGCKYCVTNCPYNARRFNFGHPHLPEDEVNPDTHYLGNRPRPAETTEKCTFCIQRTREGDSPACVETCPVGARKFGNLLDEEGQLRTILDEKRVFRLRPEIGNDPKFFYFSG